MGFVRKIGGALMTEREQAELLKSKHRELENRLKIESTHLYPDEALINNLKRQKLRIKDELASMNAI